MRRCWTSAFVAAALVCSLAGSPLLANPTPKSAAAVDSSAPLRVLIGVQLAEPYRPEGELDAAQAAVQRQRIAAAQERLADLIQRLGGSVQVRYARLPYVAAQVPAPAVAALNVAPEVASLNEDHLRRPTLLRSTALIGADLAWRSGLTGAGWAVALPDTGVDGSHPFLAGKVVAEACFSSPFGGNSTQPATVSLCPAGAAQADGPGSAKDCDPLLADCEHGTLVAGIIAGRYGPGGAVRHRPGSEPHRAADLQQTRRRQRPRRLGQRPAQGAGTGL